MASSKLILILSIFFAVVSCGNDDNSSDDQDENADKLNQPLNLAGSFSFDISLVMEFEQGQRGSHTISATLPKDYKWSVAAEDLPEGAIFENDILSWLPSCSFSVEKGDFHRGYMVHYVRFTWKAQDAGVILQSTAALIVHKFNQPGKKCLEVAAQEE